MSPAETAALPVRDASRKPVTAAHIEQTTNAMTRTRSTRMPESSAATRLPPTACIDWPSTVRFSSHHSSAAMASMM